MPDPGEALASVLSALPPEDRLAFLRYLTRKGDWPGSRSLRDELAACRDRLAAAAAEGADATPTPSLRLRQD
jgi:hypothetical protein